MTALVESDATDTYRAVHMVNGLIRVDGLKSGLTWLVGLDSRGWSIENRSALSLPITAAALCEWIYGI